MKWNTEYEIEKNETNQIKDHHTGVTRLINKDISSTVCVSLDKKGYIQQNQLISGAKEQ